MKIRKANNPMDLVRGEAHVDNSDFSGKLIGISMREFYLQLGVPYIKKSGPLELTEHSFELDLDFKISDNVDTSEVHTVSWKLKREFYEAFYKWEDMNNENKNSG